MTVETDAAAHAIAEYPREACGFVVAGAYVRVSNIASDPWNSFRMADDAWIRHGDVQAVIHSHCAPQHTRMPSAEDIRRQRDTAVPWGIILTDGVTASAIAWFGIRTYSEWCVTKECDHGHCPNECEHPQPFMFDEETLVCGCCHFRFGRQSKMDACTPETCPE